VTVDLRTGLVSGDGHDRIVSHQDLAILGSAYADHITGSNQYRELLDGRGGSDVVHGGGSSDVVLSTDAAHDQLFGDAGRDIVSGSARDTLAGGPGDDTLAGASLDAGTLSLIDPWQPGPGGAADGGPGDDSLTLLSPHNRVAQLDLAQGTFTFDDRGSFPVSAVEHVAWLGDALIYHGTEAADELDASRASSSQGITAFMGAGDDRVVGTTVRDYLDGGDGTDWVDGHGGTDDVCVAFEEGSC
jgi:Ca2+-binding RTX toxin-like protein